jgi:cytochrome c biogenesis protein
VKREKKGSSLLLEAARHGRAASDFSLDGAIGGAALGKRDSNSLNTVLWSMFSSLRLTIFLLILLAATSVLGTVILQKGTPQQILAEYGPNLARIFDFFGLFDMYHSWWFLAILALLVLNLIFCSLNRLPSVWRQVFHPRVELNPRGIESQPFAEAFRTTREWKDLLGGVEGGIRRFLGQPIPTEQTEGLLLYFEKGRYGRLGVYVTHLSVIVILIGGMIGSVAGFSGMLQIVEGETADSVLLRKNGRYVKVPLGYGIRCDSFEISYYDLPGPQQFVSEYMSHLSVLENGEEVRRETIRMNHPLKHRGLKFYQSSYGNEVEVGLQVRSKEGQASYEFRIGEGDRGRVPETDLAFQFLGYSPQVLDFGEGIQLALLGGDRAPRRIWLFKDKPDFDSKRGGDFIFSLTDILVKDFTVLQVTRDPGVVIVWVGCTLLIIGLIMAFFVAHQRLWVHLEREKGGTVRILIGGNTNRNRVYFERRFLDIVKELKKLGLKTI